MSNPSDRPWTEEEKYFLLTEILKKAGIPSSILVRLIHENHIQPSWGDIHLPSGRSMNSCRLAFESMRAQYQPYPPSAPPAPAPAAIAPAASPVVQMSRPEVTRASAPPVDPNLRKRPLYTTDRPRLIQPRPAASVASYSSESGASAQLSPKLEGNPSEPPRKRGRPSKAETERRKAAAEARGETYPPPRRSLSGRAKIGLSLNSPGGLPIAPYGHGHPQPHANLPHPTHGPASGSMPYDPSAGRPIAPAPNLPGPEERREMSNIPSRMMGPNSRELPPPQGQHLPSPHALQLGPPDPISRFNSNPADRGFFNAMPPDRFSPDSGRRDSVTSRGDPTPQGPYSEGRASTTPGEKPR